MSTRSIILVTGQKETIRLYKHSDGYPTGNLPIIFEALEKALEQCDQQNKRFKEKNNTPKVEQTTGLIIGASTDYYGIGAHIDQYENDSAQYRDSFKIEHLGRQCDLEWIYVIDLDAKTVNVYGGGYTGKTPDVAFKKGVVDPVLYADHLKAEYQDRERKHIREAVAAIKKLGFKVNPKTKSRKNHKE